MSETGPRPARPDELEAVIDAIVLAFVADPVARWMWPGPGDYLRGQRTIPRGVRP